MYDYNLRSNTRSKIVPSRLSPQLPCPEEITSLPYLLTAPLPFELRNRDLKTVLRDNKLSSPDIEAIIFILACHPSPEKKEQINNSL